MKKRIVVLSCLLLLGMILSQPTATASVIAVAPGAFPGGSALLTFNGLADNTEVNGLSVSGVLFGYSLGSGYVIIDGGPGITNSVAPPNVVSVGNNAGIMTMILPAPATLFGYGYAVLDTVPVTNATTITLFSGATNVGSLSYDAVPDPIFAGGFAGIQSTIAFDRVQVVFNSEQAEAFAFDNVTFDSAVPEPTTLVLMGLGLSALLLRRRK